MKQLTEYIIEKLKIDKSVNQFNYYPKNYDELKNTIRQLLKERGKDADLNDIDISKVTEMWELFRDLDPHNIDISKWDVSHVKAFTRMFIRCKNFNSDISNWNLKSATHTNDMFWECENFDCNLEKWNLDIDKLVNGEGMFYGCKKLKVPSWYKEN